MKTKTMKVGIPAITHSVTRSRRLSRLYRLRFRAERGDGATPPSSDGGVVAAGCEALPVMVCSA
jgi:hypothetical protein